MKITVSERDSLLILQFEGGFTVGSAQDFTRILQDHVDRPVPGVSLDLGAVEAVDVTFFQALIAFRKSLGARNQRLYHTPLPEAHPVKTAAKTLGIGFDGVFATRELP